MIVDHGLTAIFHLPGAGRTLGDHLQRQLHVQAGALTEGDALGQTLHQTSDTDLIDHLGELSGAGRTHQRDRSGEAFNHWFGARIVGCIAPHHHGQHAVLGPGLATRHRRIQKADAACFGRGVQFTGNGGRGGGVIDEQAAGRHGRKCAGVRGQRDLAQIGIITNAAEHHVGATRRLGRVVGYLAAVFGGPGIGFGAGAVVHRDLMPALGQQVASHGCTHDAHAEKSQFQCLHACAPGRKGVASKGSLDAAWRRAAGRAGRLRGLAEPRSFHDNRRLFQLRLPARLSSPVSLCLPALLRSCQNFSEPP